jgi:LysM repeat protein
MMSRKFFTQVLVLALLLLTFLAIPANAHASGVCGGTYIVDAGDTLNSIAAKCGITVSAITTANPGVANPLRTGQTLNLPRSNSNGSGVTVSIVSSGTTNYYPTPTPAPVTYSSGTYIVQYGDTFSAIASRYGLTTNQLWAANQQIWNINYLYAGQAIHIPGSSGQTAYTSSTGSSPLSYGNVPDGTPYGQVRLVNKSSSKEIYVSLQGTTRDGVSVINEYWVSGSLNVKVPAGSYKYVAWANEQQFVGYFQLGKESSRTLTLFNSKSSAE